MRHVGGLLGFRWRFWLIGGDAMDGDGEANSHSQHEIWSSADGEFWMTDGKYSVTENGQIRFIYSNDVWTMEKIVAAGSKTR